MQQQQKCSQCFQHFTLLNPPRIMSSCEHNVCTKCLKEAIQHRQQFMECSFCSKKVKKKDIKLFPKNLKLLQKLKISTNSCQNPSTPKKVKLHGDQSSISKSPSLIKQDEQLLLPSQNVEKKQEEQNSICQIHNKPFEIICATQKKRICCHCAIFGNHKEHKFRTFTEFQNEINHKTQQLKNTQSKRQQIQEQKKLSNLRKFLTIKFTEKKTILTQEVDRKFKQLIEQVKKQQQNVTKQFQEKFNSALEKINQQLSNELKLKKIYLGWQSQCMQVINKLNMTRNIKSRIQIYYDSPLQICQQGEMYLEDMVEKISNLKNDVEQKINNISIKTQEVNLTNFIDLNFPLLEDKCVFNQIPQIQSQFSLELPSKLLLPTRQDIEENSFLFDSQVSAIQIRDSIHERVQVKNRLNKSVTSINSIKNIQAIFQSLGNKTMKTKTFSYVNKGATRQKDNQNRTLLGRTRSPTQKRFGSPDTMRVPIVKQYKTPEEILIALASNDFINEVDLTQFHLNDREIYDFLKKARQFRPVKAIKLQKNSLTDQGLQCICKLLQHVSNLNLSFNNLTDRCLDVLIRNREYLYKLRIVNLSDNKLTKDRTDLRVKGRLQELKKMGIVITL